MITYFNRFQISMTLEQAKSASHQGQCDDDVKELSNLPVIKRQLARLDPKDLASELKEYGAWDETQLEDMEENKQRILWIAAGNIVEEAREKARR